LNQIIDSEIELIEPGHRYILKSDPEFKFTSCTAFIDYFFKPFDKIAIANKLTATHPNYKGMSPETLIAQWDQVAVSGTNIHKEIEDYIKNNSAPELHKSKSAIEMIKKIDLCAFEIQPEVRVYSKEIGLAGSIDLLIYDKRTKQYHIRDWKTNKKIEMKSYGNKVGTHSATSDIMDCNYYHYSLQLSLYRFILENYYGLKIASTSICHLTEDKLVPIKCDYHEEVVKKMIKADRTALRRRHESCLTK